MNSTGSFVAIKEVALYNITKEEIAPIQKEINLLKKLNHPNIVKYIGKFLNYNRFHILGKLFIYST